jgi:hypothetical protein
MGYTRDTAVYSQHAGSSHGMADHTDDFGTPLYQKSTEPRPSRWNPKTWSKKGWIIAGTVVGAVVLLAVIVGAVEGSKATSYPDYSPLNYQLEDTYAGTDFFDNFDYFTGYDPAEGFVHYVPEATANSTQFNLTYASETSAVMRVDTSSGVYDTETGRYSVRLTSKKQYNSGLFVFDIVHSPYGCSTWPALWLSDPNHWPENGKFTIKPVN